MTLYVRDQRDEIGLSLVYNADLFSAERMVELLAQLQLLLEQLVTEPDERVGGYSLVTPSAAEQVAKRTGSGWFYLKL